MRLLLDTHAFIWACRSPEKLSDASRKIVASDDNLVLVSVASAWEISIKCGLGKLKFPLDNIREMITSLGFDPLPISFEHARRAGALPFHHNDPFDRMLVAQALGDDLTLVTADRALAGYGVSIVAA